MLSYRSRVLIVGGGPAGLAAAHTLRQAGYPALILERGQFAAGVAHWPIYMKLFSTTDLVELGGLPLTIPEEKATRQQYLTYLHRFQKWAGVEIKLHHAVERLEGADGDFKLHGKTADGEAFTAQGEKVILATGASFSPNLLNVPGEDLPKVSHYYSEINDYLGKRVMIVGGRHSAAETALELYRAGVDVTLCYRGAEFTGLKYWIGPDLANRVAEGSIKALLRATVCEIRPRSVIVRQEGQGMLEVKNDAVLALTGYHPDPEFLARMGVRTEAESHKPIFDEASFESTTPGVYLIGVMLAGNISGAIFIENSRFHGERVLRHLQG